MAASKRGKDKTTTAPSSATPADKRKKGNGGKTPGPKAGTAAAKKGSAAGGRASGKGSSAKKLPAFLTKKKSS